MPESLIVCLRDELILLDLIPSGNVFYSSGFSSRKTLPLVLMRFAVISALTCNGGVPLGDHEEGMQLMGYFMPSTLRKSKQFLDQVAKIAMKTMTVIPIDRLLW